MKPIEKLTTECMTALAVDEISGRKDFTNLITLYLKKAYELGKNESINNIRSRTD